MNREEVYYHYFDWLYHLVLGTHPSDIELPCEYQNLCMVMHGQVFVTKIPLDGNRVFDAAELRGEFLAANKEVANILGWNDLLIMPTTLFEVLAALARRGGDLIARGAESIFLNMIVNLGLADYHDFKFRLTSVAEAMEVKSILERIKNRDYETNGQGGLFPLRNPAEDQRKVELWYQMGHWMAENDLY